MSTAGTAPRGLLRRLLLDADGTFVCRRRYERALDRAPRVAHSFGKTFSIRSLDCACCRRYFSRRRSVVVIFWKWDDWPLSQNDAAQFITLWMTPQFRCRYGCRSWRLS